MDKPETQLQKAILKYQKQFKQKTILSPIVRQLIQSPQHQSWYILDRCIQKMMKEKNSQMERCLDQLYHQVQKIATFTMLMYVYSLASKYKLRELSYSNWRNIYSNICYIDNQQQIFNSWISQNNKEKIVQDSLEMVITSFLALFKKQYFMTLSQKQLQSIVYWLSYFKTDDPKKFNLSCDLAKFIKENSIKVMQDYLPKQHLFLKKIIQIIGNSKDNTGNSFLLLYPMAYKQRDLNYFCNIEEDFLQNLAEQHVLNVFQGLTKVAITKQIIMIIDKLSRLYQNSDQYFKLRVLYEGVILPRIIKRAKHCPKFQEQIYELGKFYIMGFISHLDIGQEGIKSVLENIGKIKNKDVQKKWIQICYALISRYDKFKGLILDSLQAQKVLKQGQMLQPNITSLKQTDVWTVTARNGRKHKIYPKNKSPIKGIENKSNQCYIISVVQALYMTGKLAKFLDYFKEQIKQKYPLLHELRLLFKDLEPKSKVQRVGVKYLKKEGPTQFKDSIYQQDTQQYLLSLFQSAQNSMKKNKQMLNAFKKIFQVKSKSTVSCRSCKFQAYRQDHQYIITINHDQILKSKYTSNLQGYKCQKCNKMEGTIQKSLHPSSDIMIVHINRFEHTKGQTKKLLSTQTIARNFENYELKGIIFHFGRDVEHGHYIYYAKIAKNKWIEMNDSIVLQFTLDHEDQQFERQLKCQMTPYILFYTKVNQK